MTRRMTCCFRIQPQTARTLALTPLAICPSSITNPIYDHLLPIYDDLLPYTITDDESDDGGIVQEIDDAEERYTMGQEESPEQRNIAKQLASAIASTSAFDKSDTLDESGRPKSISELMRMARVTSLWPVLSELQKDQFNETTGVLANDRHYISKNILLPNPLPKKRPFVQTANGTILFV